MKFKKLLQKIHEQSGSGMAVNILNRLEGLRNYTRRPPRTTPQYKGMTKS